MLVCKSCNTTVSSADLLATCDRCGTCLCQACAEVTATELRAILLKKRCIIYYCCDCRESLSAATNHPMGNSCPEQLREEITDFTNALKAELLATFQSEMDRLTREVVDLKQSNIDLVRLLTGGGMFTGPCTLTRPSSESLGGNLENTQYSSGVPSMMCGGVQSQSVQPTLGKNCKHNNVPSCASVNLVRASGNASTCDQSSRSKSPVAPPSTGVTVANSSGSKETAVQNPARSRRSTAKAGPASIVGSRRQNGSDVTIAAAVVHRKTSVLVGRLDMSVTAEGLLGYLVATFGPADHFHIEEQTVRSGEYRSFRVEARLDYLDELLTPSNWPENVVVKKFRFFRKRPADK